jgi:hypothetical protein
MHSFGEMTVVPTYSCRVDDFGYTISFLLLNQEADGARPGFTHPVIINRHMVGYLSAKYRPSKESARFFLEKHLSKSVEKTPVDA